MSDLIPANARKAIANRGESRLGQADSLEQIKPPYPERFTPEWWSLRKRVMELIGQRQNRMRGGQRWSDEERRLSDIASGVGLDDGKSASEYEEIDPETGLHRNLSPTLRKLRDENPAKFAAISAEAKRMQSLGQPKVHTHLAKRFP